MEIDNDGRYSHVVPRRVTDDLRSIFVTNWNKSNSLWSKEVGGRLAHGQIEH